MSEKVIISFCIPTYNRCSFLLDSVQEIQKIQRDDIEIVICDNDSPDDTEKVISKLANQDRRIKYFKNTTNIGQSQNIIRVLSKAKGKYLYLTSDEDLVNYNFFEEKFEDFLNENYSLSVGSIFIKEEESYYIKEEDKLYCSPYEIKTIENTAYRYYLSGIIFNRRKLDIEKLDHYSKDKDNLYAYIPAILMCIGEGKIATYSDIICYKYQDQNQYTDYELKGIKLHYTNPRSRLLQIKFWYNVTNEVINDDRIRRFVLKGLGRRAANLMINPIFYSYGKEVVEDYEKSISSMKEIADSFRRQKLKNRAKARIKAILGFGNQRNI